jgi:LysM repeat protein
MALLKLKIESFDDSGKSLGSIYAITNPEKYSWKHKINSKVPQIINDSASTRIFTGMGDNDFTLNDLLVDGTGVIPGINPNLPAFSDTKTCDDYIDKFCKVVYNYDGKKHKAPSLKISWGSLTFRGICDSLDVKYVLFNPDGTTLRAFIDLKLKGSKDFKVKEAEAARSSPDLTHRRVVQAGDTLPLLTYQIYGTVAYYMEVARANNLTNISSLIPGTEIFFPPLKKQ